jgi:Cellulase (glycosyl hydrolase family 5)
MGQTVARVMIKVFFLAVAGTVAVCGHALPTPVLKGPLRVSGNLLFDATGNVELAGVNVPDIIGRERNEILFKVIRRRWNLNAVRLPVSVDTWVRDGDRYISSVALAVEQANAADLAVVLVARDNESLPSPRMLEFWRVWAARFRTNQTIIFDVFDKPTPATIPGRSGTARDRIEWDYWLNGGTLSDGRAVVGMKQLVDAIRSAGANQVTAVQTFSDKFGFQGFDEAVRERIDRRRSKVDRAWYWNTYRNR